MLLLAIGGDHPNKVLVTVLVALMAVGPPVSAISFMLARDYNRPEIGGTATGVVNGAGFIAAITCAAAIGGVLEIAGSGPGAFRFALGAAIAIQAFGTVRIAGLVAPGPGRRAATPGGRAAGADHPRRAPLGYRNCWVNIDGR